MSADSFVCRVCWKTFPKKTAMDGHVKRFHQLVTRTRFEDGTINSIERNIDGLFECLCGKRRFVRPESLHRHAKRCLGRAMTPTTEGNISITDLNSELDGTIIESNSIVAEHEGQSFSRNELMR